MRARNQNKSNITLDSKMENKTKTTDKDFSWILGVENETEYEVYSTGRDWGCWNRRTNKQVEIENVEHSEPAQHTENATVQRRISAKKRKETLEAYLVPTKLSNRKVVYLNREMQERADFIVRRLGDRGSNLSSFVESIVRLHLEEYGEDIEKWRRL